MRGINKAASVMVMLREGCFVKIQEHVLLKTEDKQNAQREAKTV